MPWLEPVAAPARCERFRLLQPFCDFGLQCEKLVVPQIGKVERLQITLLCRHGKQHSCLAPYRAAAKMYGQADAETLVKAVCYLEQSPGG